MSPAKAPKASFASRLFGYGVFISFALGGAPRGSQSYASDLARRLREQDLSVFFSEDEAPPGSPLSDTLRKALLRSKLLVVVVNRGTLERPNWVRTEVETFRAQRPGRPVVPVCLDGSFADRALSELVQPWLAHGGSIWLDEQAESAARGLATDALVARLLTAPRRLRANILWRAVVAAVGLGLAVLAAVAAWQATLAMRERDRVGMLRDQTLSRQLAAQATASIVRDPVHALLLAAQAGAIAATPAAEGALLSVVSALPLTRLQQHDAAFQTLAVAPMGDMLMLSDQRGAVLRGSVGAPAFETLVPAQQGLNLYRTVTAIAFSSDGRSWAHAGSSRRISVHTPSGEWQLEDGDKIGEATPSFVFGLAFSPDGRALAAVSSSRSLRLHDVVHEPQRDMGREGSRLLLSAAVDLTAVAFSPDGRWVAVGGDQGLVQAVAVAPAASVPKLETRAVGAVTALAFDRQGRWLFAASRGGRIEVFDAGSGRRLASQDVPEQGAIERMAVSPDGRHIVSGHGNGAVLLWAWAEQPGAWQQQVLLRHAAPVRGLGFGADGLTLVSAGADGRVFVSLPVNMGRWQRRAGSPALLQPPPTTPNVTSPDGCWTVTAPGSIVVPPAFPALDSGRLPSLSLPRLKIVRAADRQVLREDAELSAEMGETVVGPPVFSADSTRLAVQVREAGAAERRDDKQRRDRLLFWHLPAMAAVEGAVALPADAQLLGAASSGTGWIAAAGPQASEHFFFDAGLAHWTRVACALAGRGLTQEEWRRDVGEGRPYAPACAAS